MKKRKVPSRRGRSPLRKATEVDAYVGQRLRLRRTMLGISQEDMAARLGLTYQMIQKYEIGDNRISASRLYQFATMLDVPVGWFFDGFQPATRRTARRPALADAADLDPATMASRESLELLRTYHGISDPDMRRKLLQMAKLLTAAKSG